MVRAVKDKWTGDALVNGSRKRLTFATLQEAEAFEHDPYKALGIERPVLTVGKLFPKWTKEIYAGTRNEVGNFRISKDLVARLGADLPIEHVDRAKIKELISQYKERGNKAGTVNTKLAVISRLLHYAVDEGVLVTLPTIPFDSRPKGNRIRSLTKEEEQALFHHLSEGYQHFANFLLYTGCRKGEAMALEWVDHANGCVTFWRTKTDRPRTIPLHPKAIAALEWSRQGKPILNARNPLRKQNRLSDRPFAYVNEHTFTNEWNRAKAVVGLELDRQVVPHILRHTCATRLAQSGFSELRLKDWMGHANLTMTARYTHFKVNDLRSGLDALGG